MKKYILCLSMLAVLAGCSSHAKKILVMSKGKATIDKDAKTVTVDESGTGHEEQTVDFNTAGLSLKVKSQAGEATVSIPDDGYYILNVKNDTIVGSYQAYGAAQTETKVFTQEKLLKGIDSLQQLIEGKNISAANRNYFILPNQAVKITGNTDAFIVGPYHQMTSIAKEGDKDPEVYRFYSVKEVRELILKLQAMTKARPQ